MLRNWANRPIAGLAHPRDFLNLETAAGLGAAALRELVEATDTTLLDPLSTCFLCWTRCIP